MVNKLLQRGAELIGNEAERPLSEARILMCHVLGCSMTKLMICHDIEIKPELQEQFIKLVKMRAEGTPMAYILGEKEFWSLKFKVAPGVLIPRPDTETLVEFITKQNISTMLDICTGSGCIAVSAAHDKPDLAVTAVDISDIALKIARENSALNGVDKNITFINIDILKNVPTGNFDMIVSNPPYIRTEEIKDLEKTVRNYEPILALDGGDDGLIFYRRICEIAPQLLCNNGILAFEIGIGQYEDVLKIMSHNFKNIGSACDLAGIKRAIYGIKR